MSKAAESSSRRDPKALRDWISDVKRMHFAPHCLTYGKMMEGDDPFGRIQLRYEHQRTAKTEDFPKDLDPLCSVHNLFPGWIDTSVSILNPQFSNAGFSLRSLQTESGRKYHLFCKIMPWLEDGENPKSRRFTHLNVWAMEIEAFDILAAWPFVMSLFWPKKDFITYCFSLPATEDQTETLNAKRKSLSFSDWHEGWDFWYELLTEHYSSDALITEARKAVEKTDEASELALQTLFSANILKCFLDHIDSYLEDPLSLNFTSGIVPTKAAEETGIRQY